MSSQTDLEGSRVLLNPEACIRHRYSKRRGLLAIHHSPAWPTASRAGRFGFARLGPNSVGISPPFPKRLAEALVTQKGQKRDPFKYYDAYDYGDGRIAVPPSITRLDFPINQYLATPNFDFQDQSDHLPTPALTKHHLQAEFFERYHQAGLVPNPSPPAQREPDLVVFDGQQTRKRRATDTEFELVAALEANSLLGNSLLLSHSITTNRKGLNYFNVDDKVAKALMKRASKYRSKASHLFAKLPGSGLASKMMSTIASALSVVGEKVHRVLFLQNAYEVVERRTFTFNGETSNKRLKLTPAGEHGEFEWISEASVHHNFETALEHVKFLRQLNQLGLTPAIERNAANSERIIGILEPLLHSLVNNDSELKKARRRGLKDLIRLWTYATDTIIEFAENIYSPGLLCRVIGAFPSPPHSLHMPFASKFEKEISLVKRVLSDPSFFTVLADLCNFCEIHPSQPRLTKAFVDRVILNDIHAIENDLPPPSYLGSAVYTNRFETQFPPPARFQPGNNVDHLLEVGELPGIFPDDDQPKQVSHSPLPPRKQHAPGSGAIARPQRPARNMIEAPAYAPQNRVGRTAISIAASLRNALRKSREYRDYGPRLPFNPRAPTALSSILRRRDSIHTTPPQLRARRSNRSVRFAADIAVPIPRTRHELRPQQSTQNLAALTRAYELRDIAQDGDAYLSAPQTPTSPPSGGSHNPSSALLPGSLTPNEAPKDTAAPQQPRDDPIGEMLERIRLESEKPRSRSPSHTRTPSVEKREPSDPNERIRTLLSLPSPAGLVPSADSLWEMRRRKEEQAREEAEKKKAAEEKARQEAEKARKEAEQRARHALEQRLASSGGLRLPNQQLVAKLSKEWVQRAEATLHASHYTILAKTGEGTELRRHDFAKVVNPTEWLNDEIVNGSLKALETAIHSAAGVKNPKQGGRKCLVLSSFFYKMVEDKGGKGLQRPLGRHGVKKENLLNLDTILLPICNHLHWTLLVIRPAMKTVAHMDSLNPRGNTKVTNLALEWMKDILKDAFQADEWKVIRHQAPRQTNGWDCGVHTITNGICLALGISPADAYTAEDMPLQRLRLAGMLLNGGFTAEFDINSL